VTHGEGEGTQIPIPLDCTLDAGEGRTRVEEWTALRPFLRSNRLSPDATELLLRFENRRDVAETVRRLAAEEARCCGGASFVVEETPGELVLTIARDARVMEAFARLKPASFDSEERTPDRR
jgi:hypothetical protein